VNVRLGDSQELMLVKMRSAQGRDVTKLTDASFIQQVGGVEQTYYWWELRNGTVLAMTLWAKQGMPKMVAVVEAGPPGSGLAGIKQWTEWRDAGKIWGLKNDGSFRKWRPGFKGEH
jgi:hypothetical protein